MRTTTVAIGLLAIGMALTAAPAHAGCGCDKPPPPRASVRPFVASGDQTVTVFDNTLDDGKRYDVFFETGGAGTGVGAWSQGKARRKRDIADGQNRVHLRVRVPEVALGPTRINVYRNNSLVFAVSHQLFTVAPRPLTLDTAGSVVRPAYRAAVGFDGTIYIPVDVSRISRATRFWGTALDLPIQFQASNVAMYNPQGYLMQLLDPSVPGLFELYAGDQSTSTTLAYWRHEFVTWKTEHFRSEHFLVDDADGEWHVTGTRHVDHDVIVVAVRGQLANGLTLPPGATPPFQLVVTAEPEGTPGS
ncbi:MAG: hypothetical protein KIT14_14490 [bacterium]|nr:hypothetical protein [bacterium]